MNEKNIMLDKEEEWNKEREELLNRCHKAGIERQKEIEIRIKTEKDFNALYSENINLRNNLEVNKSFNAKLLRDNSASADSISP